MFHLATKENNFNVVAVAVAVATDSCSMGHVFQCIHLSRLWSQKALPSTFFQKKSLKGFCEPPENFSGIYHSAAEIGKES